MRQYKDSGIEWIGKIPEPWEVLQIRRIMRNRSERNQPNAMVLSLYRDFGIVPKESRDDNHNVTSEDTASYKVVSKGNFVINKMKAWQGSMAVSEYDGIVSPAYYVCYFTRDVCKKYIHYLLRDASYKPEYLRLSTGMRIGQWDLNIEDFLRIKAILPPLDVQQRIADYLDEKCSEIDSLIGLQVHMIDRLKAYKQSVITEAVTKGLDPNAKLVPSGIDWIGEIPEGWRVVPLKWILRNPLQYGANESGILFDESLPRYVRITDIINNNLREDLQKQSLTEEQAKGYILEDNDILFARSGGTVGKAFIYESKYGRCAFAGYLIRAQINRKNDSKYIYYYTQSSSYDEWKKRIFIQATIQNIGADKYSILEIPIPSLSEQVNIVKYLNGKCADIDDLIALKQQKILALKEYRKSVIYEAVTGKTIID